MKRVHYCGDKPISWNYGSESERRMVTISPGWPLCRIHPRGAAVTSNRAEVTCGTCQKLLAKADERDARIARQASGGSEPEVG